MADTLCGPSNALQQFQKHSTVDRSLQQDRLAPSRTEEQNFRTSPGVNAGVLDPEFVAFENGQTPLLSMPLAPPSELFALPPSQAPSIELSTPEALSWADDFQRLFISGETSSAETAPRLSPADLEYFKRLDDAEESSWSAQRREMDAERRISRHVTRPGGNGMLAPRPYNPMFAAPQPYLQQPISRQMPVEAPMDDAAFAAAFDNAALEIKVREKEALGSVSQRESEIQTETRAGARPSWIVNMETGDAWIQSQGTSQSPFITMDWQDVVSAQKSRAPRIGSDVIPDQREGQAKGGVQKQTELAATAGQLLENVKDDRTQKFRNSTFLGLMRQLRDGEATVEGSDIVKSGAIKRIEEDEDTVLGMDHSANDAPSSPINMTDMNPNFEHTGHDLTTSTSSIVPSATRPSSPYRINTLAAVSRHLSSRRSPIEGSVRVSFTDSTLLGKTTESGEEDINVNIEGVTEDNLSSSSPSSSPPSFSSLYFPSSTTTQATSKPGITEVATQPEDDYHHRSNFAVDAPAPPFFEEQQKEEDEEEEYHQSSHSLAAAEETKAALPPDTKGESSSTNNNNNNNNKTTVDDGEPPPPYTESTSPLVSFTYLMAAAGGPASLITQVQQGGPPVNTLGDVGADENINLDLRGTRFTLSRDELLTLPEFVLLSLFPNGLLPDGHMHSYGEGDVYPVDYDPASLQYMLDFFRSVAQSIPSRSPSPNPPDANNNGVSGTGVSSIEPTPAGAHNSTTRDMLQDRAGIIVLREDLDFYVIPPRPDIEAPEMIEVKRAAGRALLEQAGIFSGLRKSEEAGTTEQHLIEMLTAGGFPQNAQWGHRASEPNKAVICSLALARLRTDIKPGGSGGDELSPNAGGGHHTHHTNPNTVGMAQKLLLFWRKPARRCWWEGTDLVDVEGVNWGLSSGVGGGAGSGGEGVGKKMKLKVWIRRVWTLEMSVIGLR
ncbi:MAG: GTPase-activating protein S13 [Watsoniomyces obsoletus]|nr:MAG: GTPase-activating protein S13 [Watsoniomyces obsoletus]